MARSFGTNQRIVDRLLAEGKIGRDQHASVIEYVARHKTRVEEAIIELEVMSELDLLKFIATVYSTRFVSTEKLSKAAIDPRIVAKVPAKVAALHGVFPVMLDEKTGTLTVVTADPDNDMALQDLRIATRVRSVIALVARPSAVQAAINLHYMGDKNAFIGILRPGIAEIIKETDPFDRKRRSEAPPPRHDPTRATLPHIEPEVARPTAGRQTTRNALGSAPELAHNAGRATGPVETGPEILEALNVLVSLVENSRQDLRGHSAMVGRLVRKTCERIGLGVPSMVACTAAGYLHDLGKMGTYHLTPLNVAEYEGHRVAAQKAVDLPRQLMESVNLWTETTQAIAAMYERWDGKGFPSGQSGKDIPLGARILAVVDTYADLTQNPRNPYRKVLRPYEACEVLLEYRGKVFDPNVVDLFRQAMTGEDLRAKLLSDRHQVLIVDPDPEETTVLELRLIEQGFEVKIVRTAAQARTALEAGEIAAVVSEVDLEHENAGLELREAATRDGFGREVAWVMLTSKADRQTAQAAFDLGVDDFVSKPASTDIFAAKLRQIIERKQARSGPRGVTGSLAEMSLPDMVQILWHGRKTCALRIMTQNKTGEIEFAEGQVVNARWDSVRGEEAFYKMLTLREGDFRLDPSFKPQTRAITASPEALLLEGMRRLDEGSIAPP